MPRPKREPRAQRQAPEDPGALARIATDERKRHPLGRRPLLADKEVVGKLLAAVAAGASFEDAVVAADINRATFYKWRQRFEAMPPEQRHPGNPYYDFFDGLKRALVRGKVNNIVAIKLAGQKDWRALAWLLERKHPEEWGKQSRLEVSGPQGGPVPLRVELPAPELEAEVVEWDGTTTSAPRLGGNGAGNGHG